MTRFYRIKSLVAPAALVGERSAVRHEAPANLDRTRLAAGIAELWAAGHLRAVCVLELARDLVQSQAG